MSLLDHHTLVIGSTDDQHTFVLVNRPLAAAHAILVQHGFATLGHQGRTIYLLPPHSAGTEAHVRTLSAVQQLLVHTTDFVDISSTARIAHRTGRDTLAPGRRPGVSFDLSGERATATARSSLAGPVLKFSGFQPERGQYVLPPDLRDPVVLSAVVLASLRLDTKGVDSSITLGIPSPRALPPAPARAPQQAARAPSPELPARGRTPR